MGVWIGRFAGATIMYKQLSENIEKMSRLLYVLELWVTIPTDTLVPLTIFAIDYSINNLTDESIYLPFLVVWVYSNKTKINNFQMTVENSEFPPKSALQLDNSQL